ncbi:hypothetical protein V8E53_001648 [Lactarius tabidus]
MFAMRVKKVFRPFDPHRCDLDPINTCTSCHGHCCSIIRRLRPVFGTFIHRRRAAYQHTPVVIVPYWTRPWTFLERVAHLPRLDRALGPRRRCTRARSHPGRASREPAHHQHYTDPSAEPLLATYSALQGTILPLGPGTFMRDTTSVPILATRKQI